MTTIQFEAEILKPFLKVVYDNCVKEGHHLNKYPIKITIGEFREMRICYKCNDLFQSVMIEKSLIMLDDDSDKII